MTEFVNFHTAAAFLTALALGAMVFFSFFVAPATFRILGKEGAPPLISAFFGLYYPYITGTTALAAGLIYYRSEALLLALVAAISLVGQFAIRPGIERLRPGRQSGEPGAMRKFGQLHGLSMVLNLLQIGILIFILIILIR